MNRRVDTNFSIFIILVVCSLLVIVDFFVIGHKLNGSTLIDMGGSSVEKKKDVLIDDDEKDVNNGICYKSNVCNDSLVSLLKYDDILDSDYNIKTVSGKISLVRFSMYSDIDVVDGGLVFNIYKYNVDEVNGSFVMDDNYSEKLTYNIPGESIKYIYCYYAQPSGRTLIFALTESGNLYKSDYSHLVDKFDFNSITNFKLINSNVSDLRIVENVYQDVAGEDYIYKDLCAVVSAELIKIEKWD